MQKLLTGFEIVAELSRLLHSYGVKHVEGNGTGNARQLRFMFPYSTPDRALSLIAFSAKRLKPAAQKIATSIGKGEIVGKLQLPINTHESCCDPSGHIRLVTDYSMDHDLLLSAFDLIYEPDVDDINDGVLIDYKLGTLPRYVKLPDSALKAA